MANPNEGNKSVQHKKHLARQQREQQQTKIILYAFIGIILAVVGLLGYGYVDAKYLQPRKPVASVNGVSVTTTEFQARVRLEKQSLMQNYQMYQQYQQYGFDVSAQLKQMEDTLSSPTTLGKNVLDQMVNEEIIRQEAAKRGITVSADEVEAKMREIYQYFPKGSPTPTAVKPTGTPFATPTYEAETLKLLTPTSRFTATSLPATPTEIAATEVISTATPVSSGTEQLSATPIAESAQTATPTNGPTATVTPTSTLEPTATPYTEEGYTKLYKDNLENYAKLGITEPQYRQLVEMDLLRQKLSDIITADVTNGEEEVWARHILVNTEEEAKTVLDRLKKGEDFITVANEMSKDPGTAQTGGDLGWFGHGAMVAPFDEAAFSLKIGEISEPIKTDFGYHFIQVLGHQKRPIADQDIQKAKDAAFRAWLDEANKTYKVETFDIWMQVLPTDAPAQAQ